MKKKKTKTAAKLLKKINHYEPYGDELFNELSRLMVTVAIEAVVLRQIYNKRHKDNINKIEVFMTQRPKNDPFWPKQWHCPGSIIRIGEKFSDVFNRLAKKEFLTPLKKEPKFVGLSNNNKSSRGHELSIVYLVRLVKNPKKGKWFNIDDLPKSTIKHHKEKIIPLAVSKYKIL